MREHRQELNKFMKEIRARDPARRMVLRLVMSLYLFWLHMTDRYDKLYMGNDVFFYNDKSGRVERLHSGMDGSGVYNRSDPASLSLSTISYHYANHFFLNTIH